jgi:putative ABC transport system permease protein
MIWKIAFRNLVKNARRSVTTAMAIGVGGLAALLLGGFVTSIWYGVQTSMIQDQGNLQIYRNGYLEFGAANPDDYTIKNWSDVVNLIGQDPTLASQIAVITPRIDLAGVAGNVATGNSKTFIGQGVVAADLDKMRSWDGFHIGQAGPVSGLDGASLSDNVVVGLGMARMLGVCGALSVPDCKDAPEAQALAEDPSASEYTDLVGGDAELSAIGQTGSGAPGLNLMAATSEGVPNIIRVQIAAARAQAVRAIDNAFVLLPFAQAEALVYGDSEEATAIMVQINDPAQADAVKARIQGLLNAQGLELTAYHFTEVDPTFTRIFGMFAFIFAVVSAVLLLVIVFTIFNTVSMTVVERVKEIGTIRALGFRRSFVRRLFLAESALTGLFGAALALGFGIGLSRLINAAQVQWTPPSNATPLTVQLMVLENPVFALAVVGTLIVVAVIAAILPTYRASRLNIVESLQRG